jgi:IPT/TIG domain-containing protein
VTTPGGAATSATFTVTAAPTITGFSPASGPIGTQVTITGMNFTGATGVKFSNKNAGFS